ncbi:alpha/beta hydrolase [Brevundimonas sp. 2R-24]|uniref:Alpha/beta hydrolase n=1 Tax=Peiella sedimenti TaxID=3061083 RepID=A0ABT8SJW0_9CAUL|nr:alpha/beta hydrolase [Caulobacteraceae bacterium XZ-24]
MPPTPGPETQGRLTRPDGEHVAWKRVTGAGPTLIWVGGWRSDMEGTKAVHLAEAAKKHGWDYLRFDHFAHGESSGEWTAAAIGRWREDLIALIEAETGEAVILIGSSMGAWISLLAAVALPDRVKALLLIAPAPDFAHELMWPRLEDHVRQAILREGFAGIDDGTGPHRLTRAFFEEARAWALLDGPIAFAGPVRILQGTADDPVPWRHAMRLTEALTSDDVELTLIKDGDHRLSAPRDLERLTEAVAAVRKRSMA